MNGAIHMLGATSEGLKNQLLIVKVNRVDGDRLRHEIVKAGSSESTAAIVSSLLTTGMDRAPKLLVDAAIPMAERELRDRFGVDLTITAADAATVPPARKRSEFLVGAVVGGGAVALVVGVGWSAWALLFKKLLGGRYV